MKRCSDLKCALPAAPPRKATNGSPARPCRELSTSRRVLAVATLKISRPRRRPRAPAATTLEPAGTAGPDRSARGGDASDGAPRSRRAHKQNPWVSELLPATQSQTTALYDAYERPRDVLRHTNNPELSIGATRPSPWNFNREMPALASHLAGAGAARTFVGRSAPTRRPRRRVENSRRGRRRRMSVATRARP